MDSLAHDWITGLTRRPPASAEPRLADPPGEKGPEPAPEEQAAALARQGRRHRSAGEYDLAFTAYEQAAALDPYNQKILNPLVAVGARGPMDWPRIWDSVKRIELRKRKSSTPYRNPEFRQQLEELFSTTDSPSTEQTDAVISGLERMSAQGRHLHEVTLGLIILRLQFAGRLADGFALRRQLAQQKIIGLGEKSPRSITKLRQLMQAHVYLGELRAASEAATRYTPSADNPSVQRKYRKLVADARLMDGEVEPYISYSRAAQEETPLPGDGRMAELVRGRRVAVVGPADTGDRLGRLIDSYDVIVRPRYRTAFMRDRQSTMGSRTEIAYYSGHDLRQLLPEISEAAEGGEVQVVNSRPFTHELVSEYARPWLRAYRHDYSLWMHGNQLGIPRMLYDLLQFSPAEICIFNSDFYTGQRMFTPGWRENDRFAPYSHINDLVAFHDVRMDFMFTQALMRSGIVTARGRAAEVLALPPDDYVHAVEEAGVLSG